MKNPNRVRHQAKSKAPPKQAQIPAPGRPKIEPPGPVHPRNEPPAQPGQGSAPQPAVGNAPASSPPGTRTINVDLPADTHAACYRVANEVNVSTDELFNLAIAIYLPILEGSIRTQRTIASWPPRAPKNPLFESRDKLEAAINQSAALVKILSHALAGAHEEASTGHSPIAQGAFTHASRAIDQLYAANELAAEEYKKVGVLTPENISQLSGSLAEAGEAIKSMAHMLNDSWSMNMYHTNDLNESIRLGAHFLTDTIIEQLEEAIAGYLSACESTLNPSPAQPAPAGKEARHAA